jgi:hypothetical protein
MTYTWDAVPDNFTMVAPIKPQPVTKPKGDSGVTPEEKKARAAQYETIKITAASPAAIALTKAAYNEQCLAFEASKEAEDVSSTG